MSIVVEEKLTIPLYHGTSSLFIDSIRHCGLGGRNPIEHYKVVDFLACLYSICERLFLDDEGWKTRRIYIEPMVKQDITEGGFNFQHGATYLTPTRQAAVNYAVNNRYGSEIISLSFLLYDKIKKEKASELNATEISDAPVLQLMSSSPEPYLVKVPHVPVSILESEAGGSPDKMIEMIELSKDLLNKDRSIFNFNFRLLTPVPWNEISVERLDYEQEIDF